MDERGQELNDLRDYGARLLEEMKYPELIGMLQETMTHLHDIATEYAADAEGWHVKYDACAAQNIALQKKLENLASALDRQKDEMAAVINAQSDTIRRMGQELERKLNELRSYRDAEVAEYNQRVQALLATQEVLQQKQEKLADQEQQLAEERQHCENERKAVERTREEYEEQIELNRAKLDEYSALFDYKMNAKKKIDDAQKAADDQVNAMRKERDEWKHQYDKERYWRENFEKELVELKKRLNENTASAVEEQHKPVESEAGKVGSSSYEDADEDGMR